MSLLPEDKQKLDAGKKATKCHMFHRPNEVYKPVIYSHWLLTVIG